jgi:hypothetical protein
MALSNAQVSELQQQGEFAIKSESVTPKLGTFVGSGSQLDQRSNLQTLHNGLCSSRTTTSS